MKKVSPSLSRWSAVPRLLIGSLTVLAVGCPRTPSASNGQPQANTGADQSVPASTVVTLDGSGSSDPDGDTIIFTWRQSSGTAVALSSQTDPVVTFTAPDKGAALSFELTVNDGQSSDAAETRVSVQPGSANASVNERTQPSILDDPAISDNFPDGWTIDGLPDAPLGDEGDGAPEFVDKLFHAPLAEVDLFPGATHEVELALAGEAILFGSAKWIGTADALDVFLALDGVTIDTGVTYSLGARRGGTDLKVQTAGGGRATLTITNPTDAAVSVRIHLGALALE